MAKANIKHLANLYGKRWNIENFYRDAESNFMVKTKTANFTTRYFFFLFMSLLYNLWYFVKLFYPITAERWKDLMEEEMKKEIERLLRNCFAHYSATKNSCFFLISYRIIFCHLFYREAEFLITMARRKTIDEK